MGYDICAVPAPKTAVKKRVSSLVPTAGRALCALQTHPPPNGKVNVSFPRGRVHVTTAGSLGDQLKCDNQSINQYGDFLFLYKLQVALNDLLNLVNKSTTNGPLRTGHKNAVSIFQRRTLRIAAGRSLPLFQFGPGWPSS